MKLISIISPCYNEEQMVDEFFAALYAVINKISDFSFEIVIVNDGSSDHTLPALINYSAKDSRVKIIDLMRNFGKESALTAGLEHAKGDAVIIVDFDLQDPPSLIPEFIKKWQEGVEIVIGVRTDRSSDDFLKRKTAALFYSTYNIFSTTKIPKHAGDSRLLDRKIVEQIKLLPERQRFMKGLFSWVGGKSCFVEYKRQKRSFGVSKFSGWKLWNFAIEGITSFSTVPLRIWLYVGFVVSFLSFIYGLFIILRTLIYGVDVPGYSSLLTIVLFFGGIQVMGIGVLGEYLGRIYLEVKQRPIYLIRQVINQNKN